MDGSPQQDKDHKAATMAVKPVTAFEFPSRRAATRLLERMIMISDAQDFLTSSCFFEKGCLGARNFEGEGTSLQTPESSKHDL